VKRTLAILLIAVATTCAYSQVQITEFQDAFESFATDMAGSLSVNSTIGANWSDAYVGNFPHLGIGLTGGLTTISPDASASLFTSMGAATPSGVDTVGIPFPTAVASFKIGVPVLPMDVGFKIGFLPSSMAKNLMDSTGSEFKYMNWGVQLRYALIKQKKGTFIPNVSVGAAFNHVDGSVTMPTGLGSTSYAFPTAPDGHVYSLSASEPVVDLGWKSNTIDITAQVSKKFLFIVPYLGGGLTLGKSVVEGGVSSDIGAYKDGAPISIASLTDTLEGYGVDMPDISSAGFTYSVDKNTPLFRLYGGFSLRIIVLDLDLQGMYLPQTGAGGGSLTVRFQF
jgi:hypothetical protein